MSFLQPARFLCDVEDITQRRLQRHPHPRQQLSIDNGDGSTFFVGYDVMSPRRTLRGTSDTQFFWAYFQLKAIMKFRNIPQESHPVT
jgi:hypothetical protein